MDMKDKTSTTWKKLFEIKTRAKTDRGIIKAIKRSTDFFAEMTEEEQTEFVQSEWCEVFDDGIIIWIDEKLIEVQT